MNFIIKAWVKQVALGAGIVAILSLFPIGYQFGVNSERSNQREKYTTGLENLITNFSSTQTLLNSIAQGQQVTLSLLRSKQGEVREGVKEYSKTSDGGVKCLDDTWVQLYNKSIESVKSESGVKVDGKSGTKKDADKGSK